MNRAYLNCMLWLASGIVIHVNHWDRTAPQIVFLAACAAVLATMARRRPMARAASAPDLETLREAYPTEPRPLPDSPVTIQLYDSPETNCAGTVRQQREDGFELLTDGELRPGEVATLSVNNRLAIGIVSRCVRDTKGYAVSLELFYAIHERRGAARCHETQSTSREYSLASVPDLA